MEERMVRLFGSTARPRLLSLLLSRPQQTFYQREIMYETGLSLQAVQRELENLIRLGILKKREIKTRIYYQIDVTSPWFTPLRQICGVAGKG
jgi:predicted transcriptional regulator